MVDDNQAQLEMSKASGLWRKSWLRKEKYFLFQHTSRSLELALALSSSLSHFLSPGL